MRGQRREGEKEEERRRAKEVGGRERRERREKRRKGQSNPKRLPAKPLLPHHRDSPAGRERVTRCKLEGEEGWTEGW